MPPEYAIDGVFSVKSDVYSFGVLVLEMVSGKRNRGFCHPDHNLSLLGHVSDVNQYNPFWFCFVIFCFKFSDEWFWPYFANFQGFNLISFPPKLTFTSDLNSQAWRLYKEDRQLELIDNSVKESCNPNEVLRSIHVGLLCVQQCPEYRPTMSTVVLMLSSETALPEPKEPGFHTGRHLSEMDSSPIKQEGFSTNGLTITLLEAR